jgi:hypothetical protein
MTYRGLILIFLRWIFSHFPHGLSFLPRTPHQLPTVAEKTLGDSRRVMLTLRSSCASFLTALDKPGRVKGVGWMDGRMDAWMDGWMFLV